MAYALDKEKGKKEHSNHPQSSRIQYEIPSGIQWNSHRHQDWFINHVKRWDQRPRAFHFSSFETAQPNWQGRENNVFRLKEKIIYYSQLLSVQGPPLLLCSNLKQRVVNLRTHLSKAEGSPSRGLISCFPEPGTKCFHAYIGFLKAI